MARLAWHSGERTPALEVGSPATPHSLVLQGQLLLQLPALRLQALHLRLLVHHVPLQVREPPFNAVMV